MPDRFEGKASPNARSGAAGAVLLIHAFSRKNAGDGLLVDLAIQRLERVGVSPQEIVLVALDPESFADFQSVIRSPGDPARKLSARVLSSLGGWIGFPTGGAVRKLIANSRAVVAVGGGYLSADGVVTSMGALLNHGHSLKATAESAVPSIYLPQSVGPLRGVIGTRIARWLANVDVVCLRDEQSLEELRPFLSGFRIPDMAVLAIAEQLDTLELPRTADDVLVVPRRIPSQSAYEDSLRVLGSELPEAIWAVQGSVVGPKDDGAFVQRLGFESGDLLANYLASRSPAVVISVRLHGALQSLMSGWPAIHLSYDRKGWAAFNDLGLGEFVHDARSFDPQLVRRQVDELRRDPSRQWQALNSTRPRLIKKSNELSALVHHVVTARG